MRHIAPALLPRLLRTPQRIQRDAERCVLELLVGALPRPGEAVDIDDVVVDARRLEDQRFKVALKEDVLDVGLLAASIVGKRDHGRVSIPPRPRRRRRLRKIVPLPPVQLAPARLRPQPSPLLEEERDAGSLALVADRSHPCALHGPRLRPALAADNHPIDAGEVERRRSARSAARWKGSARLPAPAADAARARAWCRPRRTRHTRCAPVPRELP